MRKTFLRPTAPKRILQSAALSLSALAFTAPAILPAQTTVTPDNLKQTPAWLPPQYRSMINAARPSSYAQTLEIGAVVPQTDATVNSSGIVETYQPGGPTVTRTNAFFQPLGTNGRTCATCHQPNSAMGMSVASVDLRYLATLGTDPLFAPVDGANCPSHAGPPILFPANYSLLLTQGLIRIPLPVPTNAQYSISVVSDSAGCNTNPTYNESVDPTSGVASQIISVYRRPLMAANLQFKTLSAINSSPAFPPIDFVTLLPIPIDPATGLYLNGNIMSDGREPTLTSQAIDATLTHAQAKVIPSDEQLAQMVAFESGIYSAQTVSNVAGSLTANGLGGGPIPLSTQAGGISPAPGQESINAYDAWNPATNSRVTPAQASIYRGQVLFNTLIITITHDAGISNAHGIPPGTTFTCSSCHGQVGGATEAHPHGQHSLGIGGSLSTLNGPAPSKNLPLFKIACSPGFSTPFAGSTVYTNDPGMALITGSCADIGRFSTPQLRGLAARAPYMHDGSIATLEGVISFYNSRFNMNLTTQNSADLVAFLKTL